MTADSLYSLEDLERQWRAAMAPKLGLQLAEEHRRRGDLPSAVEVLREGLESHPDHLSSRVALSRYLVDSEGFEEALDHLERIVEIDPVHLVANKLLVQAYVGLGRTDEARDKLDIYEMLGEGDEDIETLRAAVDGEPLTGDHEATPAAEEAAEAEEPSSNEAGYETEPDERLDEGVDQGADRLLVEGSDEGVDEGADLTSGSTPSAPDDVFAAPEEEPFGSAWAPQKTTEYWRTVEDEGIFAVEAPEEPVEPEEPEVPEAEAEATNERPGDTTVTLGKLYLDQGHETEAAESFSAVLERDPGNHAAREGLALIQPVASDASTVERKKEVLVAYRARLRRAVEALD